MNLGSSIKVGERALEAAAVVFSAAAIVGIATVAPQGSSVDHGAMRSQHVEAMSSGIHAPSSNPAPTPGYFA